MPAHSDHIRRDAEHAARCEIAIALSKYVRRLNEEAKANISKELASFDGAAIDGTTVGREAARSAITGYLGLDEATPAIEARPNP